MGKFRIFIEILVRRETATFGLQLCILLVFSLATHLSVLHLFEKALLENLILPAYLFNFLYVTTHGAVLRHHFKIENSRVGWIFLYGSAIKFMIFFIFFYPYYSKTLGVDLCEFLAFFVPYGVAVSFLVFYLVNKLNRQL